MRYINTLHEGEQFSEIYLVKTKQQLKTKAGKSYCSLILQDMTGVADAKIWEMNAGIEHFEQNDYVMIDAQVTVFQGSNQLNIRRLRRAKEGEFNPKDYIPVSEKNIEEMYKELLQIIDTISDEHLKKLAQMYFVENKAFSTRFKEHSAAKTMHHGFMGGLLEHTLAVVKICDTYASQYPFINRDLLCVAAMFHDVGKLEEISDFPENDYTDEGQLIGHIVVGAEWIKEATDKIEGFPKKLSMLLRHCILAHHGEYEFGSPKKPAIVEAVALHFADNADAKIQAFREALSNGEERAEWLGYQKAFESNLRRTIF